MKRRGVLGGLLGAATLKPSGLISTGSAPHPLPNYGNTVREDTQATWYPSSKAFQEADELFSKLSYKNSNFMYRKFHIADQLGMPPHLYSMQSNSLAFRALRTAQWRRQLEDENSSYLTKLRKKIFEGIVA
jgi:hypothetical protein